MDWKNVRIVGLPLKYFIPVLIILLVSMWTGTFLNNVIGGVVFLMMVGGLLSWIGGAIPFVGQYLGGSVLLPLFGGSALVYFGLVPDYLLENLSGMSSAGAINLFIIALIVGSIFSIDRKMLIETTKKIIPLILGSLLAAIVFMVIASLISGKGILEGVFMVGAPSFTAGSAGTLGIVPEILGEALGEPAASFGGELFVYQNISNILCILAATVLNQIGQRRPELSGEGTLVKVEETEAVETEDIKSEVKEEIVEEEPIPMAGNMGRLTSGLIMSLAMVLLGSIVEGILPFMNFIAWASVLAIAFKALGWVDDEQSENSALWQQFASNAFLPSILTLVGITSINLGELGTYFSLSNLFIIAMGLIGALLGSYLVAKMVGFYPIDSMISIGANLPTIGVVGSIQTLTVSNRMDLMGFATVANRVGGAIMTVLLSITINFFV